MELHHINRYKRGDYGGKRSERQTFTTTASVAASSTSTGCGHTYDCAIDPEVSRGCRSTRQQHPPHATRCTIPGRQARRNTSPEVQPGSIHASGADALARAYTSTDAIEAIGAPTMGTRLPPAGSAKAR